MLRFYIQKLDREKVGICQNWRKSFSRGFLIFFFPDIILNYPLLNCRFLLSVLTGCSLLFGINGRWSAISASPLYYQWTFDYILNMSPDEIECVSSVLVGPECSSKCNYVLNNILVRFWLGNESVLKKIDFMELAFQIKVQIINFAGLSFIIKHAKPILWAKMSIWLSFREPSSVERRERLWWN